MKERHDHMDRLIKEALEAEIARIPAPPLDKEEAWDNIYQSLLKDQQQQKRAAFRRYTKIIGSAAVVVLFLAIAFYHPQASSAFNWVKEFFLSTEGDVTELSGRIGEHSPGPNPPPEAEIIDTSIGEETMTLAEAQERTDFNIMTPEYVPEGYSLDGVTVLLMKHSKSSEATVHYTNGEDTIDLREQSTGIEMAYSLGVDSEDTKEVTVNGEEAVLFILKDGLKKLVWENQKILFMMDSSLPEDEILQIAKSIK